MGQLGSNWAKWGQTGPIGANLDQTEKKGAKWMVTIQGMVIILGMVTFLEMVTVLWIVIILGMVTILVMVTILRDGDHHKGW